MLNTGLTLTRVCVVCSSKLSATDISATRLRMPKLMSVLCVLAGLAPPTPALLDEATEAEVSRTPEDSVCSNEGPSAI